MNDRLLRGAERGILALSALLLGATMLIGAANVLLGIVLGWYVPAVVEFSEVFVAAAAFLALPVVTGRQGHVSVDVLTGLFGAGMQAASRIVTALVTTAVCGFFAATSWDSFLKSWAKSETVPAIVPIPLYPVRFCAALAFIACAILGLVLLLRSLRRPAQQGG